MGWAYPQVVWPDVRPFVEWLRGRQSWSGGAELSIPERVGMQEVGLRQASARPLLYLGNCTSAFWSFCYLCFYLH